MSDAWAIAVLLLGAAVWAGWLCAATAAVRRRRTAPVVRVLAAAACGAAAGVAAAALGVPYKNEWDDVLYWASAMSVLILGAVAAHGFGLWGLLAAWRAAEAPPADPSPEPRDRP